SVCTLLYLFSFPTRRSSDLLGALARGFLCDEARLVVVTDAEIFGRYKVQRPRRLKSAHAQATRSALDIDFTDLEESDYVVHLQQDRKSTRLNSSHSQISYAV